MSTTSAPQTINTSSLGLPPEGLNAENVLYPQRSRSLSEKFHDARQYVEDKLFSFDLNINSTAPSIGSWAGIATSIGGIAASSIVPAQNLFVTHYLIAAGVIANNVLRVSEMREVTPYDASIFQPTKAFDRTAEVIKRDANELIQDPALVDRIEHTADDVNKAMHRVVYGDRVQAFVYPVLALGASFAGATLGGIVGGSAGVAIAHGEQILYNRWRRTQCGKIESGLKEIHGVFFDKESSAYKDDWARSAPASRAAPVIH
jgi:hypothetical protein